MAKRNKNKNTPAPETEPELDLGLTAEEQESTEGASIHVGGIDGPMVSPPAPDAVPEEEAPAIDAALVQQIQDEVYHRLTTVTKEAAKISAHKQWYKKEGKRRYRVLVSSNRSGIQSFEMHIPHPDNTNQPVLVRGRCGVIIEEGLNWYTIKQLQYTYHMEQRENPIPIDPRATQGMHTISVKVKDYTVEILDEVKNPKPIGFSR